MASYLIQDTTLTTSANKIREKLEVQEFEFISEVIDGNGGLVQNSVTVYYTEFIDVEADYETQEGNTDFNFVGYAYYENNNGKVVPVLLDDYDIDAADPHYYEGRAELNGVVYDKWRKIEDSASSPNYAWDSNEKCYKYTNIIIDSNVFSPLEFPDKIDEVFEAGRGDAFYNCIPAIIQLEITEYTTTNYDSSLAYSKNDFVDALVGDVSFNIDDMVVITNNLSETPDTRGFLTITNNNSYLSITTYIRISYKYSTSSSNPGLLSVTEYFREVEVAPEASSSISLFPPVEAVSNINASYALEYVKWSAPNVSI